MKKKFLISGLALFAGALAFTFSGSASSDDMAGLFVSSDNIAFASFSGCITNKEERCVPGDGKIYWKREWTNNNSDNDNDGPVGGGPGGGNEQ